jgi:hypothetical protein
MFIFFVFVVSDTLTANKISLSDFYQNKVNFFQDPSSNRLQHDKEMLYLD